MRLASFWFGIQAVWGALLGISLQARCEQIGGAHALALYGFVAGSGAVVAACTQLAVGPISDRRRSSGSRRIEFYVTGAALGAVALVAFYRAHEPWSLMTAFAGVQAGLNVAVGPYQAAIPDAAPRGTSGAASAWMAALQSAGNAAGALLGTVLDNLLLLACVLAGVLLAACAITSGTVARWPALRPVERVPFRLSRAFALLFASRVALFSGFYTLLGYLYFYVLAFVARDASRARFVDGTLVLAFTAAAAIGAAVAGRPADRLDRRNVAAFGALVVVAALGVFIGERTAGGAYAAASIAGAGWGVLLVADWAIACRVIPVSSAASAMAVWNLAVLIPQMVAPVATTITLAFLGAQAGSGAVTAFLLAGGELLAGIWLLRCLPVAWARE